MSQHLLDELHGRGLIAQETHPDELRARMAEGPLTLYCGFDPTADSLHIGSLVPLITLKRFQMAGHTPLALVGGATGMIGDPSFKAKERQLNTDTTVQQWTQSIRDQVAPFLHFDGKNSAQLVNNHDWFSSMNVLDFLRDIGKHFTINQMMNKESVKARLEREDQGISFTEFSYSLLQGFDFQQLHDSHGCELQIGGSDQWGNIVSGIDLTRKMSSKRVFGLTLPLVTKADGTKFGKTESGTVWLSPHKTSPFQFFQFWKRTDDRDVISFLKMFTFLSLTDIQAIEQHDNTSGQKPTAHDILAREMTRLVHGEEALQAALRITEALFSGHVSTLTQNDWEQLALDGAPTTPISAPLSAIDLAVQSELADSKSQARSLLKQGGFSVNGVPIGESFILDDKALFHCRFALLKRGKRELRVIVMK